MPPQGKPPASSGDPMHNGGNYRRVVTGLGRGLDGSVAVTGIACGRTVHLVGHDPNIKPELRHIRTISSQQPHNQAVNSGAGSDTVMTARCVCFSPDARTIFVAEAAAGHALPSSLSFADLAPLTVPRSKQPTKTPGNSSGGGEARPPPSGSLQSTMKSVPGPRVVAYDTDTLKLSGQSFPWRTADNEDPDDDDSSNASEAPMPASVPRRESGPTCIAAAMTGAALACGTDNGVLRVWDLTSSQTTHLRGSQQQQRLRYKHRLNGGAAVDVAFSGDGRFIVAVAEHSAHVAVLKASDGTTLTEVALDRGLSTVTACCATFLPIGHVMTTNFEALETELTPKFARSSSMDDVFPLPEDEAPPGLDVAVGCSDGYVRLFNVARRRLILGAPASAATIPSGSGGASCRGPPSQHTQPANTNPSRVFAVSCDGLGRRIATASADGVVSVFTAATQPHVRSSSVYTRRTRGKLPRSLGISADGGRLIFGTDSGSVELVDAGAEPHVRPLGYDQRIHTGRVRSAAYSPDGRLVATTGIDGNLCLLGVSDVRRTAPVTLPQAPTGLAFSEDALIATVGDVDGADAAAAAAAAGEQSQQPKVGTIDVFGSLDQKEFEATPGVAAGGGCMASCTVM